MSGRKSDMFYFAVSAVAVSVAGMIIAGTALAGENFAIPAILALGVGGTIVLRGPLGGALARRIEGATPAEPDVEPLHQELDEMRGRMVELEERLDFTERFLAREREAPGLPAGEARRSDGA